MGRRRNGEDLLRTDDLLDEDDVQTVGLSPNLKGAEAQGGLLCNGSVAGRMSFRYRSDPTSSCRSSWRGDLHLVEEDQVANGGAFSRRPEWKSTNFFAAELFESQDEGVLRLPTGTSRR